MDLPVWAVLEALRRGADFTLFDLAESFLSRASLRGGCKMVCVSEAAV